ncbi:hypothetical protein CBR_g8196 [Chara braunii]|uniref:Uncharacterized protein n=1 Tax=Chara braunii TaxID=69332 RepID=A0A388KLH1_CHABU|nr:hypothetical protein CBR_g8196 [Chara braunii]|eukprot:GBG70896.1 hypothetical protein CBR_g8196 [Chara braunii]
MASLGSSEGSGGLIGVEGDEDAGLRGVSRSASEVGTAVLGGRSSREAAPARTAVRTSRRLSLSQVSVSERLLLPLLMVAICCGLDVTLSAAGRGGGGGGLISTVEAAVKEAAVKDPLLFAGKRSTLSSDESHLIMAAYPFDPSGTSWVVSLDVLSGVRLSTPVSLQWIYGLAFSPNHTALYMADVFGPPRVLVAEVAGSSPLPASLNTTVFLTLNPDNFSRPAFGPYSFPADGNCLYFLDDGGTFNRVWALHIASRKLIPLAGREQ